VGYEPAQLWGVPTATAGIDLINILDVPSFPTIQDLDNEFDGWPKSSNPFIKHEMPITQPTTAIPTQPIVFSTTLSPPPMILMLIANMVHSEDKLFCIAYSQEHSHSNKKSEKWFKSISKLRFRRILVVSKMVNSLSNFSFNTIVIPL
jgi:hypothetical protein